MRRTAIVRVITLALAFVHSFPARRHLALFVATPSLTEGWKGFGSLVAIALYLLPVRTQACALARLWREQRAVLRAASAVLVVAHAVPALDHVPRFVRSPSWYDGWRGLALVVAMAWFASPQAWQGRVIGALGRLARAVPARGGVDAMTRWLSVGSRDDTVRRAE